MKGSEEIDLHSCSNELQLLLRLLNEEEDSIKLIEEFYKKVDWKEFLQLVYFHKVYPSIYLRLSSIDSPYLPNNVVKIVEDLYKDNTIKMLQLIKELDNISTALTKNKIRMLTLKGPILSYYLYGDLSSRTSNDLDILISFQDLKSTIEILQANGYEMEYEPPRKLKDWQKRNHHLEFLHKEKNCKVEVHWRLHPGPSKEPSFEDLWNNRKTVSIGSTAFHTLGEEILCYYLVTHGARHGWFRIRWLVDIVRLLKREEDINNCPKAFMENQSCHLYQQVLYLVENLQLSPKRYQRKIKKQSKGLAQKAFLFMRERINFFHPPDKIWDKEGKKYLFMMKPFKQKAAYISRKFYANSWDAEVLPLPKSLHFLYLPLRPILWLWRVILKQKVSLRRL